MPHDVKPNIATQDTSTLPSTSGLGKFPPESGEKRRPRSVVPYDSTRTWKKTAFSSMMCGKRISTTCSATKGGKGTRTQRHPVTTLSSSEKRTVKFESACLRRQTCACGEHAQSRATLHCAALLLFSAVCVCVCLCMFVLFVWVFVCLFVCVCPPGLPPQDHPSPDLPIGPPSPGPPKFSRFFFLLPFHTTARELQTCTFEGPGASNTTKIPEFPREKKIENGGGRRKKKVRNFGPPTLRASLL